jgi:tRNA modification GTPase
METIYALATAPGKSGVAVIRISGSLALNAAQKLAGKLPNFRVTGLRSLRNEVGELLDQALVIVFSKGHSFTGEDIAELHLHGGAATVKSVLTALSKINGLRMAEPGEFTRRALENGCLDLAQVEGLSDLLEAETEAQRKQALQIFSGALGKLVKSWRSDLLRAVALLEATIDFVDEDVPVDVNPEVLALLNRVMKSLVKEAKGVKITERIRDGFEVAIVGSPNVGKSTLLNKLAGREAAIVSEIAGTTRDVIEVRMDLNGIPVTILDTAGLRSTDDTVESIGIKRAVERAERADLRVFLYEKTAQDLLLKPKPSDIIVRNKADLLTGSNFSISAKTGLGIEELVLRISNILNKLAGGAGTAIRERHRIAISKAIFLIDQVIINIKNDLESTEILAEDLHHGIRALDCLVGRVGVEQILDEIFSSFCIGK